MATMERVKLSKVGNIEMEKKQNRGRNEGE
jgi:hypothetical protein